MNTCMVPQTELQLGAHLTCLLKSGVVKFYCINFLAELVSKLNSFGTWKAWRYLSGNQRIQRWQDVGRVMSGLQNRTVIYWPNNCSHGNCKTWQFDFLRDIMDRWSLQPSIYKSRAGLKPNYALSTGQP